MSVALARPTCPADPRSCPRASRLTSSDTFASLLLVHDPDPVNARTQLGHADPSFTIEVYYRLMRRSPEERAIICTR